jgi:hypothetical protein
MNRRYDAIVAVAMGWLVAMALLVLIGSIASCATLRPTPTPAEATCAGVCARGAELGCIYATPTPKGATCETVCQNATASGEPWRLSCLAQATNCEPTACP